MKYKRLDFVAEAAVVSHQVVNGLLLMQTKQIRSMLYVTVMKVIRVHLWIALS